MDTKKATVALLKKTLAPAPHGVIEVAAIRTDLNRKHILKSVVTGLQNPLYRGSYCGVGMPYRLHGIELRSHVGGEDMCPDCLAKYLRDNPDLEC